ncbi:MAG: FecR domain-containing protein [Cytophagales bacterium]|nr:FecR domain-containing protein [Cytophagales bacterium]
MDKWNEKFKEKLGEYQHQGELTDDKVASFFNRMDNPTEEKKVAEQSSNFLRIAASVTVFLVTGFALYFFGSVTVTTGAGEFASVELPDGSKVDLKYQSSISYHEIGWMFNREVQFEGEGFFEVEKGSKFSVISAAGTTAVLGTSFNIKTRAARYEVKCYTGRVSVVSGAEESMLTPGDATMFQDRKKIRDFKFDAQTPNWSQGEIHFEDQPLRVVIDELEKVYDLSVEYADSLGLIRYTGFFPTNDLQMALRLTCEPLDLGYKIEDKTVSLFLKED